MNRRFGLSVLAYFVVTMLVAYPWHMVLFHEQYVQMGAFTREAPIMPLGIAAILLQGVVFAYFFPLFLRHKTGGHPLWRGIQFSVFLGLVVYTVMVFATAAKFQIEPVSRFLAYGTAFQLLQFVCVGIALGWIHRNEQVSPDA